MPTLDEIHRHVDAAGGDDPRHALIAVRKLLIEDVPWLERRAVQLARHEQWTWARISRLLARSRQAVRQRFEALDGEQVPDFESSDEAAKLAADAEMWLQRVRATQARRMAELTT